MNEKRIMTELSEEQQLKLEAIEVLRRRVQMQLPQLEGIDPRLAEYYVHSCEHVGVELGDENDLHNVNELLCAIRLLRLLRTYEFNRHKVDEVIHDGEGDWQRDRDGFWVHLRGGLKQPSRQGSEVYRWEPFQIFMLVAIYGPEAWVSTETAAGERRLLESERINGEGIIEDLRRLCTRFVLFGPRKINKSGFCAITNVEDFMRGDADAATFCVANSQQQSKILYKKTKDLLMQLDPTGRRIRFTATETNWKEGQFRSASLRALAAGGNLKDGEFGSRCAADEYGSAGYTNGKSDMGQTVAVVESSMGPRREPMTIITTTAGHIKSGPFIEILDAIHKELRNELAYERGELQPTLAGDRQMFLLLEPDAWEREDEYLFTSKSLRAKINPMLGKIVQHAFYDQAVLEARQDETKRRETIAKLFNIYLESGGQRDWIQPEEVRKLQVPLRIDDCKAEDGWIVFCGCDFSKGADLNSLGWLAVNIHSREFFADTDAWMSEEAAQRSPLWELYKRWADEGWLTLVPGKTFDPAAVVRRVAELTQSGVNIWRFGYDPYNAAIVINALSAFIVDLGRDPRQHIMPVSQSYATYNSLVKEFDYMVHRCDQAGRPWPQLHFSESPILPWQFGNVTLDKDPRYDNEKPIKKNPGSEACKVDSVQAILSALKCYDVVDGGKVDDDLPQGQVPGR